NRSNGHEVLERALRPRERRLGAEAERVVDDAVQDERAKRIVLGPRAGGAVGSGERRRQPRRDRRELTPRSEREQAPHAVARRGLRRARRLEQRQVRRGLAVDQGGVRAHFGSGHALSDERHELAEVPGLQPLSLEAGRRRGLLPRLARAWAETLPEINGVLALGEELAVFADDAAGETQIRGHDRRPER